MQLKKRQNLYHLNIYLIHELSRVVRRIHRTLRVGIYWRPGPRVVVEGLRMLRVVPVTGLLTRVRRHKPWTRRSKAWARRDRVTSVRSTADRDWRIARIVHPGNTHTRVTHHRHRWRGEPVWPTCSKLTIMSIVGTSRVKRQNGVSRCLRLASRDRCRGEVGK